MFLPRPFRFVIRYRFEVLPGCLFWVIALALVGLRLAEGQSPYVIPGSTSVGMSVSQTATVALTQPGKISKINVVTEGATGLDFIGTGTGTCATFKSAQITLLASATCTVAFTFNPKHPWSRNGAIELLDANNNVLGVAYLVGVGNGPQVAIFPNIESLVGASGQIAPIGVALDGSGNAYIVDKISKTVLRVPASDPTCATAGDCTAVGGNLNQPVGVAVDGAGFIYIADKGNNQILKVSPYSITCTLASACTQLPVPGALAVAVDQSGDVFVATGTSVVKEVYTASSGSYSPSTVLLPAGANPVALAVDSSGNLYVSDQANRQVFEVPAGSTTNQVGIVANSTNTNGVLVKPQGIAIDASGNIYVTDTQNNVALVFALSNGSYTSTITLQQVLDDYLEDPEAIAVDPSGNLYLADTGNLRAAEMNLAGSPTFSLGTVPVGATITSAGPQPLVFGNSGNTALNYTFQPALTAGFAFALDTNVSTCPTFGSTTAVSGTLAPGATCYYDEINFTPTVAGPVAGSLTATDNNLNVNQSVQTINVTGAGVGTPVISFGSASVNSSGTLQVPFSVAYTGTTAPTGAVTATFGGVAEPASCSGSSGGGRQCDVLVPTSGLAAGSYSVVVNEAADQYFTAATGSTTLQYSAGVSLSPASVTFGSQPIGSASSGSQVVVLNTGLAPLTISSVTASGDFSETNNCGLPVQPSSSCTISVIFTPTLSGSRTGTLNLTDSAASSPQQIPLSGVGGTSGESLQTLVNLTTTTGELSQATLIQASDGNFYGTAPSGGSFQGGTLFSVTPAGILTVLHNFNPNSTSDGSNPLTGVVEGNDGSFYGETAGGGANGMGALYKFSGGQFSLLYSFAGSPTDGESPSGPLVQGVDGNFYGVTQFGGASSGGTVFKLTSSGVVILHSFAGGNSDGQTPNGALVQSKDGYFYGVTQSGGTAGAGIVYRVSSNGSFAVVHSFSVADTDAGTPQGALVQYADGNFYGASAATSVSGPGAFFSITPNGTYSLVAALPYPTDIPQGSLTVGANGDFYLPLGYRTGLVFNPPTSSAIAQITSSGTFTQFWQFTGVTTVVGLSRSSTLATPGGVVQGMDGNLYGLASGGGSSNEGFVYGLTNTPALPGPVQLSISPSTPTVGQPFTISYQVANGFSDTMQYCFATNTAGDTTGWVGVKTGSPSVSSQSLTAVAAGTFNYTLTCGGVESAVIAVTVTSVPPVLGTVTFSPASSEPAGTSQAITVTDTLTYGGVRPTGTLTYSLNGVNYGAACTTGGSPEVCTATVPAATIAALPVGPYALSVNFAGDHNYGATTAVGGPFTITVAPITLLGSNSIVGTNPTSLIQASDGNFYGVTGSGGPGGAGTVFRMTPAGVPTVLHSFGTGTANGSAPSGSLIEGSDGNFYGSAASGGANNNGIVYRVSSTGAFAILYSFQGLSDGSSPLGPLVQANDGNLYGVTNNGSFNTSGNFVGSTIFRLTPAGNFSLLYTFTTAQISLYGGLVQGIDGYLYGELGSYSFDVPENLYRLSLTGANYSNLGSLRGGINSSGVSASNPVQYSDGNFYVADASGNSSPGVLYSPGPGSGYSPISLPFAGGSFIGGLTLGSDGDFYATGGGVGNITTFKVAATGTATLFSSSTLVNNPSGLIQGMDGNFYGTAYNAGTSNSGIVFELPVTPALPGPVQLSVTPASPVLGQPFTMSYKVVNAYSDSMQYCFATNTAGDTTGWTGVKTSTPSGSAQSLTGTAVGSFNYTLTCGGVESNVLNVTIQKATPTFGTMVFAPAATEPANTSQAITISDTLSYVAAGPPPTGTVSFMLNGLSYPAACSTTGSSQELCTATVPAATIAALGQGVYTPTSSFAGDSNYVAATGATGTFTISQSATVYPPPATLVSFNGTNGSGPFGNLIQASDGNFYGSTSGSANGSYGTVFSMTPAGVITTLHTFTGSTSDGSSPEGGLIEGTDGNFYGTTELGGASNLGTFYKITPTGSFTLLHSFQTSDGMNPLGSLIQATDGNFYGITQRGGANGAGTVFQATSGGSLAILHNFQPGNSSFLGGPVSSLIQGVDGNLYGQIVYGLSTGAVIRASRVFEYYAYVYQMSLTGAAYNVLASVDLGQSSTYSPEGNANLVQYADGNFYGSVTFGGSTNQGAFFRVSPSGSYTLLDSFSAPPAFPWATTIGSDGNFYVTTGDLTGSAPSIVELNSSGAPTLLSTLAVGSGGAPWGVIQSMDGNFYGTTSTGGVSSQGSVFELQVSPALPGPVQLSISPANPTVGQPFTMSYKAANAYSDTMQYCFATNTAGDTTGWTGLKTGLPTGSTQSLTAPSAGNFKYTLTCGGVESDVLNVTVAPTTLSFGAMIFSPAATEPYGTSQAITISDTLTYGGVRPSGAIFYSLNGVGYAATCTTTGSPETCTAVVPAATIAALPKAAYPVTGSFAGDSNYVAATAANGTFTIGAGILTFGSITFSPGPTLAYGTSQAVTISEILTYPGVRPAGAVSFGLNNVSYAATCTATGNPETCSATVSAAAIAALPVASYIVTPSFAGDSNYAAASPTSGIFTVSKGTVSVSSLVFSPGATVAYGTSHAVTISESLTYSGPQPNAGIGFFLNNVVYTATCTSTGSPETCSATVPAATVAALPVGFYSVFESSSGDSNYTYTYPAASPTSGIFTVSKGTVSLGSMTFSPATAETYGTSQAITISDTLSYAASRPTGTIAYVLNGVTYAATCTTTGSPETCSATIPAATIAALPAGMYAVTGSFAGDASYAVATTSTGTFTVNKATVTLGTMSFSPSASEAYGSNQAITISDTIAYSGSQPTAVSYTLNGVSYAATCSLGGSPETCTATVPAATVAALPAGVYATTGAFAGDGNYAAATATTGTFTVTKANVSFGAMTFSPAAAEQYGSSQAIVITETLFYAGSQPTGAVNFVLNGVSYPATCTSVSGTSTCSATIPAPTIAALPAAVYPVTGSFAGDGNYVAATIAAGTFTIGPATTRTVVTTSATSLTVGQTVTLTANVSATTGGNPAGSVTFYNGAVSLGSATLNGSGIAILTLTPPVGTYGITATFGGSSSDLASTSATPVNVAVVVASTSTSLSASAATLVTGQPLTLTATVAGSGAAAPTGTVTFHSGATILGTSVLNGSGIATLTITPVVGSYSITAAYAGDSSNGSSSSPSASVSVVNIGSTTFTLGASAATITYGQSLTLTGTAIGAITGHSPTGNVSFTSGTGALGTSLLSASGVATYTFSPPSGTYQLGASYSGDSFNGAATAIPLSVTVNPAATTVKLASSVNPVYAGATVLFTVSVQSGAGVPSGTVILMDGPTILSSLTLNGGTATFSTSGLAIGTHNITAAYTASGNFGASQGSISQVVLAQPTFTVSASAPLTLVTQHHGPIAITVTPLNGFTGTVTLVCRALPANATCEWGGSQANTNISVSSGAASTQLVIDTSAVLGYESMGRSPANPAAAETKWPVLAGLAFPFALLLARRRKAAIRSLICLLLLFVGVALSGCSGKYPASTPPGTYSVTIVATSGSIQSTGVLTLIVTN